MVTNDWKKVSNDDGDEFWMYFQSSGKAMKNKIAKIGENKYAFDDNGYMLSGWLVKDEAGAPAAEDWKDAVYYFGDENDGAMKTGWQALTVDTTGMEDFDETEYWFYFKPSNGQKYAAADDAVKEYKINGKWYAFDGNCDCGAVLDFRVGYTLVVLCSSVLGSAAYRTYGTVVCKCFFTLSQFSWQELTVNDVESSGITNCTCNGIPYIVSKFRMLFRIGTGSSRDD